MSTASSSGTARSLSNGEVVNRMVIRGQTNSSAGNSVAAKSDVGNDSAYGEEGAIIPAPLSHSTASSVSTVRKPEMASRTLSDVQAQVAMEVAVRSISKAEGVDGVKVGVTTTLSKKADDQFVRQVAAAIKDRLLLQDYLFAILTTGDTHSNTLMLCGSSDSFVQRSILLSSSKFLGRIEEAHNEGKRWVVTIRDAGTDHYDNLALWDVVRKSARAPIDPLAPPPNSRSIDQILSDCRAKLQRITPKQAHDELHNPTLPGPVFLVDIRPVAQREEYGGIPGSLIVERNVLEWRMDPRCDARLAIVDRYDLRVIVFCQEGYTSSLAAFALQELGLLNATDIIGGYRAWQEAGYPVDTVGV